MKLELIKSTEVEDSGDQKIWFIVCIGSIKKYHHNEDSAKRHYDAVKSHYSQFGTITSVIETLLSEEINTDNNG